MLWGMPAVGSVGRTADLDLGLERQTKITFLEATRRHLPGGG
jgi:hypothetical protein